MTRIAMISLHTSPLASEEGKETGGMNVYVLKLSQELAKDGIFVDIYTYRQNKKQQRIITISPKLRVIHIDAETPRHIPKKRLLNHISEFSDSMCSVIQKEQISYDLIHSHYYLSGLVALKVKEKLKKPIAIIHMFHTLGLMKNLVAREENEREDKERIASEFLLADKANAIIASSDTDKLYLQYLYNADPHKVFVITPGVDTQQFKPIDKTIAKREIQANVTHKIILFVGRIEPLKGIDGLIYAMKILRKRNPNLSLCLWIVGGDISQKSHRWSRELQKLEEIRNVLHLNSVVTFVGQQHQKNLPFFYNASEIVVMPSHYESFGIAALEAMACGIPVITTNVSGITDLLTPEQNELVTSVNNPLELSEKIEYLITNQKVYRQISQEIISLAKGFDWKITKEKLKKIYNNYI